MPGHKYHINSMSLEICDFFSKISQNVSLFLFFECPKDDLMRKYSLMAT